MYSLEDVELRNPGGNEHAALAPKFTHNLPHKLTALSWNPWHEVSTQPLLPRGQIVGHSAPEGQIHLAHADRRRACANCILMAMYSALSTAVHILPFIIFVAPINTRCVAKENCMSVCTMAHVFFALLRKHRACVRRCVCVGLIIIQYDTSKLTVTQWMLFCRALWLWVTATVESRSFMCLQATF